ncbi:MAG: hypothetical protein IKF19_04220 [Bacilli bacterium]|nr:hypothetical protein [Bacilli bacterium]
MNDNVLKVRVFDMDHGLTEYTDIKSVRIVSKDYNLLIMQDYMPIIGEIVGSVDITGVSTNASYKQIKGFYMNRDNVFNLMIEE